MRDIITQDLNAMSHVTVVEREAIVWRSSRMASPETMAQQKKGLNQTVPPNS
jgi:hypothetical protein